MWVILLVIVFVVILVIALAASSSSQSEVNQHTSSNKSITDKEAENMAMYDEIDRMNKWQIKSL